MLMQKNFLTLNPEVRVYWQRYESTDPEIVQDSVLGLGAGFVH